MKKQILKLLLTCTLLMHGILFSQNSFSEIKYSFIIDNNGSKASLDCALFYDLEKEKSTFINFGFTEKPENSETEEVGINGEAKINKIVFNDDGQMPEYQKYFREDSLIGYESVYGEKKYYNIIEKLPEFKWEFSTDTKIILGNKVQKATTTFRGRDYIAWFSLDINISDGPYKFHGLPGLILEIESTDKRFKFQAYSLKLGQIKEDFSILNLLDKYPKNKTASIKGKLKIIEKNTLKEEKYQMSKTPGMENIKIEHSGIEIDFSDLDE